MSQLEYAWGDKLNFETSFCWSLDSSLNEIFGADCVSINLKLSPQSSSLLAALEL